MVGFRQLKNGHLFILHVVVANWNDTKLRNLKIDTRLLRRLVCFFYITTRFFSQNSLDGGKNEVRLQPTCSLGSKCLKQVSELFSHPEIWMWKRKKKKIRSILSLSMHKVGQDWKDSKWSIMLFQPWIVRAHLYGLKVDQRERRTQRGLVDGFLKAVLEKWQQFVMKTLIGKDVHINTE